MLVTSPALLGAQSAHRFLRKGDDWFGKSKYTDAEKSYSDALKATPANPKATYNLGTSLYRQGKYKEAEKPLTEAAKSAANPADRADALHNLGNALLKQEKYQPAVKAYQNSLLSRPGDAQTKQNLQLAQQKWKEQQQKEQDKEPQNQGNQNKDQNNQNQNDPSQNQDNQNKDQNNQNQNDPPQNQDNQQSKDNQQNQGNKPPQNSSGGTPKQAQPQSPLNRSREQLLENIGRQDQEIKQKYQQKTTQSKPMRKRKDW